MSRKTDHVRRKLDVLRVEIEKTEDLIDLAMVGLEEAKKEEAFLAKQLEQMVIDELFPSTEIQVGNFSFVN